MRIIKIKASEVQKAFKRAATYTDDWQAECLELLMIPKLHQRWQELNAPRLPGIRLVRVPGRPHKGYKPEDNQKIGEARRWREFAGVELILNEVAGQCHYWNRAQDEYYGHSPGSAWNGVCRETICRWVEAIRMLAHGYDHPTHHAVLKAAKIEYVNDQQTVGQEVAGANVV